MQEFQRKLRDEAIKERNREIAAIIERLGDETHDAQKLIVQQNEKKIREVESKWKHDVDEYKSLISQWKEKFASESESRKMLDDNLRVLGRRVSELELECQDKADKLAQSDKMRLELQYRLSQVHEKEQKVRDELEDEVRLQLLEKEKELRKAREAITEIEGKHRAEIEQMKLGKQQDLEIIEEKIRQAMAKKTSIIESLVEESRLKEVQIEKLRAMLDK